VIRSALARTEGVLGDPGPWIYVEALGASAVDIAIYFWTDAPQANVLRVTDRVATAVKAALDAAGADAAFPRTVVHFESLDAPASSTASPPSGARRRPRLAKG
jgi:small-conductance mechanosensitive channel